MVYPCYTAIVTVRYQELIWILKTDRISTRKYIERNQKKKKRRKK